MAKLIGQYLGQLSGTIGATVFSSNQFGSHVYTKKPKKTKPYSGPKFLTNFNQFFPILWANETDSEKSGWNSFAKSFFNNPKKKSGTKYTGITTFKSCIGNLNSVNLKFQSVQVNLDNGHSYTPVTFDTFAYPNFAPASMVTANLFSLNFIPVPLTLEVITMHSITYSTIEIGFRRPLTEPTVGSAFSDPKGHRMGIVVYCTKPYKKGHKIPADRFSNIIFWSGFISFPGTDLQTASLLTMFVDFTGVQPSAYRYTIGYQYFNLTVCVCSTDGCIAVIGQKEVQLELL